MYFRLHIQKPVTSMKDFGSLLVAGELVGKPVSVRICLRFSTFFPSTSFRFLFLQWFDRNFLFQYAVDPEIL